jgi:Uncharacterized protein conserved in bacteria
MSIERDAFLKKYKIKDDFLRSNISWNELQEIADDYERLMPEFQKIAVNYVNQLNALPEVHSVRFRLKDIEHLIEKIIRKSIEYEETNSVYNIETYLYEITDIIGIRALYVFKSDYYPLHNSIVREFKKSFCEKPQIKLRRGDNEKIYEGLKNVEFQFNETYRSIHYTIRYMDGDIVAPIEIQTRSIFEEGWSEINHKLLYKNNGLHNDEKMLLNQASSILSSLAGDCDTLGQLMNEMVNREDESEFIKDITSPNMDTLLNELVEKKL